MTHQLIRNVRAVLPDRILDSATVEITDGRIAAITSSSPGTSPAIDGRGRLLMAGYVDSHSDGLEKEISPRRTVEFPLDFAVQSFERRLHAAGVTTVIHGLAYQDRPKVGRSVSWAQAVYDAIEVRRLTPNVAVEHGVLYRFEARDEHSLELLLSDIKQGRTAGRREALVSFEDHTPGQGQYRDPAQFAAALDPDELQPGTTPEQHVAQLMVDAEKLLGLRNQNLARLTPHALGGTLRLIAHDLENVEDVKVAAAAGASVAEFPVTLEAAEAAREHGMSIVMGAPNALRGASHSGNVSARELVTAGLCDVIASDYMPSALIASAFALAQADCCTLVQAVRLITTGPADMTGYQDRGQLAVGAVADLVLVDDTGRWPEIISVYKAKVPDLQPSLV